MADELDALLERVDDAGLRSELRSHIERLRRRRQFGLVFESHLPERVRLPDHPIRRGSKVVRRDAPPKETPQEVLRIKGKKAVVAADGDEEQVARDDLVVVAEFGEPIYPGLRRLGSIDRGGDKPAHVVIKGENYHALEALRFSHAGKVDCIYIDPPYNTGARDWKYDNDYVDADDGYRHSKWLAFMERRLKLVQDLLNPDSSLLVVTIDEREHTRLGMLLEQLFPESTIQMVTTVIKPSGSTRGSEFSRVEEFIYFVWFGAASPSEWVTDMLREDDDEASAESVTWHGLRRRGSTDWKRSHRPNGFYPIYFNTEDDELHSVGTAPGLEVPRETVPSPPGTWAAWPLDPEGQESRWQISPDRFIAQLEQGTLYVSSLDRENGTCSVTYLKSGDLRKIDRGELQIVGRDESTGRALVEASGRRLKRVKTVWNQESHDASTHGTALLSSFIGRRRFPFPKSLYAVEDTIRLYVGRLESATVLDFFAGSGTTAHAVARLNRQDGGRRQSISVTNNEVSADEAEALRGQGIFPGEAEWEAQGIFEQITRPRIEAAMRGRTPEGELVMGDYRFTDEFPMAEGFEENVEFLELKYLDIEDVELDLAFESVAPLLWLRSGGSGPVIDHRCSDSGTAKSFDLTEHYGVLFDPDYWREFVEKLPASVMTVFVVTDSPSVFASVAAELPSGVDVVRLYENYLSTFAINRGR